MYLFEWVVITEDSADVSNHFERAATYHRDRESSEAFTQHRLSEEQ